MNPNLWAACIAGVLEEGHYVQLMKNAGFKQVALKQRNEYSDG